MGYRQVFPLTSISPYSADPWNEEEKADALKDETLTKDILKHRPRRSGEP